jgi:uncharacterized membrane protein
MTVCRIPDISGSTGSVKNELSLILGWACTAGRFIIIVIAFSLSWVIHYGFDLYKEALK